MPKAAEAREWDGTEAVFQNSLAYYPFFRMAMARRPHRLPRHKVPGSAVALGRTNTRPAG
jgi:hypothetical protein